MVCIKDIYTWFKKDLVSSQKIDLMCNLLKLCLPMELRFIGSCLEAQVQMNCWRDDLHNIRSFESKANEPNEYCLLATQAINLDSGVPQKLCVYVALLRSNNIVCTKPLLDALRRLFEAVRIKASQCNDHRQPQRAPINGQMAADMVLLFTMAAHHPAFTFEHCHELSELLRSVRQLLRDCHFIVDTDDEVNLDFEKPTEVLCNGTNDVGCQTPYGDELPPAMPAVNIKDIAVKRVKGNSFLLCITWSDFSIQEVTMSFQQLKMFHDELATLLGRLVSEVAHVEAHTQMPQFPFERTPPSVQRHTVDAIQNSFRELLKWPVNILQSRQVMQYLRDALDQADQSRPDLSPSPRRPTLISSQSAESVVVTRMSGDFPMRQSAALSATALTTTQFRSPEPGRITSASKSSPLLSTHRGVTGSSRHSSPGTTDNINNVVSWLKEIRLHKYTDQLAQYTWDELMRLKDDDLQSMGLTSGARRKFFTEIVNRLARLECEAEPTGVTGMAGSESSVIRPVDPRLTVFSRSSSLASPINIDSSCGSEYSTPPGSPDDYTNHLVGRKQGSGRTFIGRPSALAVDIDKANDMELLQWSESLSESQYDDDSVSEPTPRDSQNVQCYELNNDDSSTCTLSASMLNPDGLSFPPQQMPPQFDQLSFPVISQPLMQPENIGLPPTAFYSPAQFMPRFMPVPSMPMAYMAAMQPYYTFSFTNEPSAVPCPVDTSVPPPPAPSRQPHQQQQQQQRPMDSNLMQQPYLEISMPSMPVPSDAVLVRPRLPVPHAAGSSDVQVPSPNTAPQGPVMMLSSPPLPDSQLPYQPPVESGGLDVRTSVAMVFGGGFMAPPVHSSTGVVASMPSVNDSVATFVACCQNCGHALPPYPMPHSIVYQPAWAPFYPVAGPPLPPNRFTVAAPGSANNVITPRPPIMPPTPSQNIIGNSPHQPYRLPNAMTPEMLYHTSYTLPPPMAHAPPGSPGFANMMPCLPGMAGTGRVRAIRPPPACANCGLTGHVHVECKEATIDSSMGLRQFHLNFVVKSTESD